MSCYAQQWTAFVPQIWWIEKTQKDRGKSVLERRGTWGWREGDRARARERDRARGESEWGEDRKRAGASGIGRERDRESWRCCAHMCWPFLWLADMPAAGAAAGERSANMKMTKNVPPRMPLKKAKSNDANWSHHQIAAAISLDRPPRGSPSASNVQTTRVCPMGYQACMAAYEVGGWGGVVVGLNPVRHGPNIVGV